MQPHGCHCNLLRGLLRRGTKSPDPEAQRAQLRGVLSWLFDVALIEAVPGPLGPLPTPMVLCHRPPMSKEYIVPSISKYIGRDEGTDTFEISLGLFVEGLDLGEHAPSKQSVGYPVRYKCNIMQPSGANLKRRVPLPAESPRNPG